MINFGIVFWCDFGSNLGPSWDPSWGHVGVENRPGVAQDASQDALGARPRPGPQNGSKMKPPDPQNELPEHPF